MNAIMKSEEKRFLQLEAIIERSANEVGKALLEIRDERLYKKVAGFSTFEQYCRERWGMRRDYANKQIRAAEVIDNLDTIVSKTTPSESVIRPLTSLVQPEQQREAWALATQADPEPTAIVVAQAVEEVKERRRQAVAEKATFNQVNDNIGWARWSWNPVTGCLHNCDYCYARDIANRFYAEKFEPTFHPERLDAPANTPPPAEDGDPEWRRVFTCSMADLFGKWVPQKWIKLIFKQIEEHQEWEFLCLTKFPQRLAELDWPANVWAGTTVDRQHRVENAERSFSGVKAGVKWLSCEPLLEPLKFNSLAMFDWVVIGASTGSTLAAPFAPPFEWVVNLYMQAKASGCKVYLKHNLFGSEEGRAPGMQPIHEWPR